MTTSEAFIENIHSILENLDIIYAYDEERGLFRYDASLHGRISKTVKSILVDDEGCAIVNLLPIRADMTDKRAVAALYDFICRMNYTHNSLLLEIDPEDGEISCKTFIESEGSEPSVDVITEALLSITAFTEEVAESVFAIIFYGISADAAIKMTKGKLEALLRKD